MLAEILTTILAEILTTVLAEILTIVLAEILTTILYEMLHNYYIQPEILNDNETTMFFNFRS